MPPPLSACIEMLFRPETPDFNRRIRMAADAGFRAIEFWGLADKDLGSLNSAIRDAEVSVAGFLAEPMVPLADPTNHAAFIASVARARDIATALGARHLIAVAGPALPGVPRAEQMAAAALCLEGAAALLAGSGVVLALEPVNVHEHANSLVWSTADGLDIVDTVGAPELRLLYDMFHSAVAGETMTDVLAGRVDRLAHVHLADHPGRHEPGTGAIPWRGNVAWLAAHGYTGGFGLEYRPAGGTVEGLAFIKDMPGGW